MNQEFRGEIDSTHCPELIKILSLGRRTGRLSLNTGFEAGNIYFRDGDVVHATCSGLTGKPALFEMASWTTGDYTFLTDETPDIETISMPTNELLEEIAKRLNQMDKISSIIPSGATVYAIEPDVNVREIILNRIQWRALANIDGHRSIADIAQDLGLGLFDTMKVFYTLVRKGLIKENTGPGQKDVKRSPDLPHTPVVNELLDALTDAIGPIAPVVIKDTSIEMDIDLTSEDMDDVAYLIEAIAGKIPSEESSLEFLGKMTSWLRPGEHA